MSLQIPRTFNHTLAHQREVVFEGMGFVLSKSIYEKSPIERWGVIMTAIVDNIVDWFQDDIFSKKMGVLLTEYNQSHESSLGELLVLLVMVRQRPPNWEKEVERFIKQEQKNSFYLSKIFSALRCELEYGFSTERNRLELRRLAAISLAKHDIGAKTPNKQLIETATKALDGEPQPEKKKGWRFVSPKRGK
jgi:hypothetical protein